MKKTFKLKLLLLLALNFSHSQNRELKAQRLLEEVNLKMEIYKNFQIDFKYVLVNEIENIRQETSGKIIIEKNKYILDILGVKRIYDGNRLYTISPEDQEVTISKLNEEDENTISPSNLFNFFEEGYNYNLDIVQIKSGRKIQYIKLFPIDSESEISYLLLGIDTKTKQIDNLIEIGYNDTKTILSVINFESDISLPESNFNFDESKYNGYYINNID
mgnify:FL=1